MIIGLDAVDKFFWTVFDFIVLRPRRFYELRVEDPSRYMSPVGFFIANFVLYETVFFAVVRILSQYWDLEYVASAAIKVPEGLDLSLLMTVAGSMTVVFSLLLAGWIKLAAVCVRRSVLLKDIVLAICYGSAFNGLVAAAFGLAVFIALVTGSVLPADAANNVGRAVYMAIQLLLIIPIAYCIAGVASLARVSMLRLLLGILIVAVVFLVSAIALGVLIAVLAY